MTFVRAHLVAVLVVVCAAAAAAVVLTLARPPYRPALQTPPPDPGLPYTTAVYTVADARRRFPGAVVRSRLPAMTDLSTPDGRLEITVFGDRATVAAAGFYDATIDAGGRYVKFPRTCANGARTAERWLGNIRVLRRCG